MKLPDPVAKTFRDQLADPLETLLEACELQGDDRNSGDTSPVLLGDAFRQFFDAMQRTEASLTDDTSVKSGNRATAEDVSELGEYGLELFERGTDWAERLDLPEVYISIQSFTISLACWIARHGGQLFRLEAVVDALAQSANRTQESGELLALYQAMGEILDATAVAIRRDLEKTNPGRPWRVLNLNRAIVATRTHQPDVMDEAFAVLTEHLPQDAPKFFMEGMEQMELLNYPPHVREVMDRYYRKWSVKRSLH